MSSRHATVYCLHNCFRTYSVPSFLIVFFPIKFVHRLFIIIFFPQRRAKRERRFLVNVFKTRCSTTTMLTTITLQRQRRCWTRHSIDVGVRFGSADTVHVWCCCTRVWVIIVVISATTFDRRRSPVIAGLPTASTSSTYTRPAGLSQPYDAASWSAAHRIIRERSASYFWTWKTRTIWYENNLFIFRRNRYRHFFCFFFVTKSRFLLQTVLNKNRATRTIN